MEEQHTKLFDTDVSVLDEIKRVDNERRSGNSNNSLPIVDVAIPQTIAMDCPLVRPFMCYASNCKKCEYFKGIVQKGWDDKNEMAWSAKYAIRCGYVLERSTRQMVIE